MQIKETKKEELKWEGTVTMTAEEVSAKMDAKLEEVGKTAKIPGFRPGKVPLDVLKSKYGKSLMGEVLEAAVNESSMAAVNENKLRPAMRPNIEVKSFDEDKGLEYDISIDLLPEIKLADFSSIKVEQLTAKPGDKEMTEALERIAESSKSSEKVEADRASKTGDILKIDFDGTVDGEPFDGMKGDDFELELGSNSFVGTFEEQLTGCKAGDKKTVTVTFPDDYGHDKLQGVEAVFEVTVHELREKVAAKIDDEFAKKIGFDSLDKVKEAVGQQMQAEYDQLSRLHVKRVLLDALDETHTFNVPEGMVESEFKGIWQQVKGGQAHGDEPDHVHGPDCEKEHGTEEERAEFREIAARRVKLGLVLAEVGREHKVEVSNEELQQAVITEARKYPGQEKQVFEYYQKNPQAIEAVKAPIYEDKVVDIILEKAKVDKKEVSIEELKKASEEEEADAEPKKAKKETKKKKAS